MGLLDDADKQAEKIHQEMKQASQKEKEKLEQKKLEMKRKDQQHDLK